MENLFKNWITRGNGRPFYARRRIDINKSVKKAVAYVCGLGQFNFFVNEKKAGDHVLDPAWSDYNKIVYYVEFDITALLVAGSNTVGAEVGNGWFIVDDSEGYFFRFPDFMPPNPNPYKPFGEELILGVRLFIEFADGSEETVFTDENWETAIHPVIHSNCYGSEVIDGRKKINNWFSAHSDDTEWQKARISTEAKKFDKLLIKQSMPAVKVTSVFSGKYIGTVDGKSIYDFGRNISGMLKFEVKGKAGETVCAYPCEKLTKDGNIDQFAKNWLEINVCEDYILAENDVFEEFEMTFTYIGGRYVGITSVPENIRNVELRVITSAYEDSGEFFCDDERLMKIYGLIETSVESNMVSVHTDCPTIERFAWQEENHLMTPSIMYLKNVKPHWEKFLSDTRLAQHTADDWFNDMTGGKYYPGDGLIPSQAPCYIPNVLPVPGLGDFYNIIGWGSSIILGTYWHYLFYGDKKIIEDNYDAGKKYLNFLKTEVNEDGFINNGLGDWGNPAHEYAKENIETAFLFADAKYMAYFAEILGKASDKDDFSSYAGEIKKNYNDKLLVYNKETGAYCYKICDKSEKVTMTQAAEALPLFFEMVPEDKKDDVVKNFKITLKEAGCLKTGEVGQPYIIQTMCKYGLNNMLYEMIMKPEHPGYYAFVLAGETSLGEYWEENPRSHNHDMLGHIMEWIYNGLAGIRPVAPGFSQVSVKPWLPESMNRFKCSYNTPFGKITVEGKRVDGEAKFEISVPDGITLKD